jgi:integrase
MPHKFKRKGKWTGQWYGQVKHLGKRERGPLVNTKDEALSWEEDTKKLLRNPQPEQTPETPTVCLIDWATKYMNYAARYQPSTYSEKKNIFKRFFKVADGYTPVSEFKVGQALEYLQAQIKDGFSPNKARKNLGAAWSWGLKYMEDFPTRNPFLAVEEFPEKRQPRYVPTEKHFSKVLDLATGQDWTMLLTFAHTAGRRSEIYGLHWEDVDFGQSRIRLWTRKRKGGKLEHDWLPMTGELHEALRAHRENAVNEWVFPQGDGREAGKPYLERRGFPQELCEAAKVKPFGLHAIRHLTASILAKANVPMIQIQAILRHKKLSTTEGYIRGLEPVRPVLKVLEGRIGQKVQQPVQQDQKSEGPSAANA